MGKSKAEHDQCLAVLHGPAPEPSPDQPSYPLAKRRTHPLLPMAHSRGLQGARKPMSCARPRSRPRPDRPGSRRSAPAAARASLAGRITDAALRTVIVAPDGTSEKNTSPDDDDAIPCPAARIALSMTCGIARMRPVGSTLHRGTLPRMRPGRSRKPISTPDAPRPPQSHPAPAGVVQAVDQVQVARSAARAHRQLAG